MSISVFDCIEHINLDEEEDFRRWENEDLHKYVIVTSSFNPGDDTGIPMTTFDRNAEEVLMREFIKKIEVLPVSEIGDFLNYHYSYNLKDESDWVSEIGAILFAAEDLGTFHWNHGLDKGYIKKELQYKYEVVKQWLKNKREYLEKEKVNQPKGALDHNQQILLLYYLGIFDTEKLKSLKYKPSVLAKIIGPLIGRSVKNTSDKISQYHLDNLVLEEDHLKVIKALFEAVRLDTTQIDTDIEKAINKNSSK